jgi:riboflavin kinase / FMN adenylyltransferase
MDVFEGHRTLPARLAAPAVAIGNFDGVHLGHQALLRAAIASAARLGGRSVALTFDPHPSALLAPHQAPPMLTTRARKLELFAAAGIDVAVVEPFTPALATLPAPEFVDQILVHALGARHVVIGYDFHYGAGRAGTGESLRAHGARADFTVEIVDRVTVAGEPASSTRVRGHLRAGDLEAARRLLGRRYDVDGVVVHGAKRGRAIGVPTANVAPDGDLVLAAGIYACRLDGMNAVASLGTNPTFVERGRLVLEVHVLDWDGDLYDRRVRVEFVARLRDEAKFDSVAALVAQIEADVAAARKCLADDQR